MYMPLSCHSLCPKGTKNFFCALDLLGSLTKFVSTFQDNNFKMHKIKYIEFKESFIKIQDI